MRCPTLSNDQSRKADRLDAAATIVLTLPQRIQQISLVESTARGLVPEVVPKHKASLGHTDHLATQMLLDSQPR